MFERLNAQAKVQETQRNMGDSAEPKKKKKNQGTKGNNNF